MIRESGYYWVSHGLSWSISEWDSEMQWWHISGNERPFYDNDFDEIDERRIMREE